MSLHCMIAPAGTTICAPMGAEAMSALTAVVLSVAPLGSIPLPDSTTADT